MNDNVFLNAIRLNRSGHAPYSVRAFARRALLGLVNRPAQAPERVVVLGLGNVRWGDAGLGVRVLERFKAAWTCPAQVELVDGSGCGRALLPLVESTQHLIVLSAVDFACAPGTLRVLTGDAALEFLYLRPGQRLGMSFADALACAQLNGRVPRNLVLIGMQPETADAYRERLSCAVRAQLDPAVDAARHWLSRWRIDTLARAAA